MTLNKIKRELLIDEIDTTKDAEIAAMIETAKAYLIAFTRNDKLDFENDSFLDIPVVYLSVMFLNDETNIGATAGKTGENMGVNVSFIDQLPKYLLDILRLKYYRVNVG